MITVQELINNLTIYAAQSPENGNAEVMLMYDGDMSMEFGKADDVRGMGPNERYLVLIPHVNGKRFKVRELKVQ